MILRRTCQEVTRLVLLSEERPPSLLERASLHLHWLACGGCRRFRAQAALMRSAAGAWRRYRDDLGGGDGGPDRRG